MDDEEEIKTLKDYVTDLTLFSLSPWEQNFIADMQTRRNFSFNERKKILEIAEKYEL